jgi:heme/copper-type cytochrome/quinol oxidase subunit 4
MILLLILFAYWAYNKGRPLRWYELLALVIGYLLTVYPVNIFINNGEELYVLAGVMLALGLIILIVDIWYILHRR